MFFPKESFYKTGWHIAAKNGQIELLHKLWEWAKEVLTPAELNNMFLAEDFWIGQPGTWQQRMAK